MKSQLSRAGGALAALAVGAGLALTPTAAQAATTPQAEAAAGWLAGDLPADNLVKVTFGADQFPDFGLTIDYALAFYGLGVQTAVADGIVDSLAANPATIGEYTTNVDFGDREDSQIAGATAKAATVVQARGGDPTDFGGQDLISDVEGLVADDGPSLGRAMDRTDFDENSNAIGQSFVVRSLTTAGSDEATAATDYLVAQQCDNGGFLLALSDDGCGTATNISIDTTAFVVQALAEAGDAGYEGADAAIADAVDFLVDTQAEDGSFSDVTGPNSNSTGLAAVALATGGESAAATAAADYVADLQISGGENAGAIAFTPGALEAGTDGELGDQFRRATAQAAPGLAFASEPEPEPEVGPVAAMSLDLSIDDPKQGDTITVTATGEDAEGNSTGDVSDEITLSSSVETDTVKGNTVTFNTASPHTITAVHTPTGTTASVTVQVTPLAAAGDDATPAPGAGGAVGASTVGQSADSLPDAGTDLGPWQLAMAAAMVVAGGALLVTRRLLSRS